MKNMIMVERFLKRAFTGVLFLIILNFLTGCAGSAKQSASSSGENYISIENSRDYAPACMKIISEAKSELYLMLYQAGYYDNYPGSDSNLLIEEVEKAIKRGVKVKAIIDVSTWNDENLRKNTEVGKRFFNAGAEVYFDNPDLTSHQKVIMADGIYSVVASANWTHYSLKMNNEVGVVVKSKKLYGELLAYFGDRVKDGYKYTGEESSIPCKVPEATPIPEDKKPHPRPSEAEILKPAKSFDWIKVDDVKLIGNRIFAPETVKVFNEAKKEIDVTQMTAYYCQVPPYRYNTDHNTESVSLSQTNDLFEALRDAKKRGVDVRFLLDRSDRATHEDTASRLVGWNIDVYLDDPDITTHAKMAIADDYTVVGSTNWTFNALEEGNEASVLIKSKTVADKYREYFNNILTDKKTERYIPGGF